jgi:hypothetical protein
MNTIVIPLYGGIGNLIQTLPFAFHCKDIGFRVVGLRESIDYKESENLLLDGYDIIVDSIDDINISGDEILIKPQRLNYNPKTTLEWQGWFYTYNMQNDIHDDPTYYTPFVHIGVHYNVCICPTCKPNWIMKQYPYWNELIQEISKYYEVCVIGFPKDKEGIEFNERVHNVEDASLLEIAGIMKGSDMVVANEGGMAHLAAAQGTRTFILFGGSSHIKNMPPSNAIKISANLPCQPCQFNGAYVDNTVEPPIFYGCNKAYVKEHGCVKCLKELKVEDVIKQSKEKVKSLIVEELERNE